LEKGLKRQMDFIFLLFSFLNIYIMYYVLCIVFYKIVLFVRINNELKVFILKVRVIYNSQN
jgi:hypothetical protein